MRTKFTAFGQEFLLDRIVVTNSEMLGQYKAKVVFRSVEIDTSIKGASARFSVAAMAEDYDVAKALKTAMKKAKKSMKTAVRSM